MAGYSGTPLPQKLGFKSGLRIAVPNLPPEVEKELRRALADCEVVVAGKAPVDLVLYFVRSKKELLASFATWASRLTAAGMLWIAWPKRSSGVPTDLDENKIREIGLSEGLVDVKVCAISQIWSGLKFVRRVADRAKQAKRTAAAKLS